MEKNIKKTRYKINFDSKKLIQQCIENINTLTIDKITYRIDQYSIEMSERKGISGELLKNDPTRKVDYVGKLPNVVEELTKRLISPKEQYAKF